MHNTDEWIAGFLARHGARYQPIGWPTPGTEDHLELLHDWTEAFEASGVTEDEANRASRRMAVSPPQYNYRRDHLPSIMAVVRQMRAERAPTDPTAMTREAAESASRNCPHCSGSGLATVEHPHPDAARKIPRTVAAHCVCQMGRWMRSRLAATDEHTLKRIPDLADVLAGRTGWRYDDPTKYREPGDEPEPGPAAADIKRGLNDVFRPAKAG